MTEFSKKVYEFVRTIPAGETRSYGDVAAAIGHPGAARAVGSVLKKNTDTLVPCHRVIKKSGEVGEYNGLRGDKGEVLRKELGSRN